MHRVELLASPEDHRDRKPKPVLDHLLQFGAQPGGRLAAIEHDVAALDVSGHILESGFGQCLPEIGHGHLAASRQVDAAQQGDVSGHHQQSGPMTRLLGLGRTLSNVDGRAVEKMANLIYGAITSLDGYVEDEDGKFDWAEPDEEVHRFVNDLQSTLGTHLYGRRLYEVMSAWETMDTVPGAPPYTVDFARIWQAAEKIVYSGTLEKASTANTRIEREFEPEAVQRIKDNAATDLLVGGAALAAVALKAGLVDEVHLFVVPMVVGGGKRALPDGFRQKLELLDEHRFGNGTVFLRYRTV